MRLALALTVALLSADIGKAAETPGTMTMAKAATLSDEELTRYVLALFDQAPAVAATRRGGFASLADQTIQIERPSGFMMPGLFPVGFDHLTLVLRAKATVASATLCEQSRITLLLRPTVEADYLVSDPPTKPSEARNDRTFIPLVTAQRCSDVNSDSGAIASIDATTVRTGLRLFSKVKALAQDEKSSWLTCAVDWSQTEGMPPEATCLQSLAAAHASQIFRIEACDEDAEENDAPRPTAREQCIVVTGASVRERMVAEGWRAYIVYRPGFRPQIRRVRLEPWGYVV